MKCRGIFEYEYPTEHKPPVSIDVHLHGDCVKGKIIEWEYRPLEQEPTKNDLSSKLEKNSKKLDCISREQTLVAIRNLYPSMPRVDFNGSLRKWVDKYKPYMECEDAIKDLPSVTPQEPRKGHWIDCDVSDDYSADGYDCSVCGVNSEYVTSYCPNCGAKMEGEGT